MSGPCPRQRELRAFHDGSLAPAQRLRLESHLRECSECATHLTQMEAVDTLLLRCRPQQPQLEPEESQELFRRALQASGVATRGRRWGFWRWQLASVAMVTMIISGLAWRAGAGSKDLAQLPTVPAQPGIHETPAPVQVSRDTPNTSEKPVLTVRHRDGIRFVLARPARWKRHRFWAGRPSAIGKSRPAAAPLPLARPAEGTEEALEPVLLVSVTRPPALSVTVTQAAVEAPGYARAESLELTPTGRQVVTSATVSSCAPPDNPEPTSQEPDPRDDIKECSDEMP